MINIRSLFDLGFWFTPFPGTLSVPFRTAWFVAAIVLVLVGIGCQRIVGRRRDLLPAWQKWWRRVGSAAVTAGIFAAIFLFFRYELTPWFSARYWMLFWFVGFAAWAGYLLWLAHTSVRARAMTEADDRRRRRYLP